MMPGGYMIENNRELNCISIACSEIQRALNEQLHTTTNTHYKADIEKDLVMLNNLQHIVTAVKADLDSATIGASTELLLRIAANDFKNKLIKLPDKKTRCREIIHALNSVHKRILYWKPAGAWATLGSGLRGTAVPHNEGATPFE
jgi:hypothetical protein